MTKRSVGRFFSGFLPFSPTTNFNPLSLSRPVFMRLGVANINNYTYLCNWGVGNCAPLAVTGRGGGSCGNAADGGVLADWAHPDP